MPNERKVKDRIYASLVVALVLLFAATPSRAGWSFAVVGDTRDDFKRHQVFPEMIKEINQTSCRGNGGEIRPEFLLHLGDMEARRGSRDALERFKERLKNLKVKYYVVKGNHELAEQKRSFFALPSIHQVIEENQEFAREYLSLFDLKESYYSFDHRDLHAAVLDNSFGTFQTKPGEDVHSGQLQWLEKDLEETARKVQAGKIRHTIVCAHNPLPSPAPEITRHDMLEYVTRHYEEGRVLADESARYFWEALEKYRKKARIARLFFAHDHRYVSYRQRGFPVTVTGGGGAPLIPEEQGGFYHYLLIRVTEQEVKERIIKVYPARKSP